MNRAQKMFLLVCGAIAIGVAIFVPVIVVQDDKQHEAGIEASAQDTAILSASADGACQKYATPFNSQANKNWHDMVSSWTPSIVRDSDNRAEVTYYSGSSVMDREVVARDEAGEWHAQ